MGEKKKKRGIERERKKKRRNFHEATYAAGAE
jgi:hypothetical protein